MTSVDERVTSGSVAGTLSTRHCPKKSWGWEEWIVNNDLYCGKKLHFEFVDGSTSLHFHVRKHETMYVEKGVFSITIIDTADAWRREHILHEGESLVIPPNTPHRIVAKNLAKKPEGAPGDVLWEAVLVEFSTHHEDSDSYRIAK